MTSYCPAILPIECPDRADARHAWTIHVNRSLSPSNSPSIRMDAIASRNPLEVWRNHEYRRGIGDAIRAWMHFLLVETL